MQPSQQTCRILLVSSPLLVAEPVAGVVRNVELALGVVRQAMTARLVVRAAAVHRGVVLGDVEIDRPGPQGRGQLAIGGFELVFVPPVEMAGRMASSGAL